MKRMLFKVFYYCINACCLTHCMLGKFHAFVVYRLFSKLFFSKKSFRNTIRVSNGLDPDQGITFNLLWKKDLFNLVISYSFVFSLFRIFREHRGKCAKRCAMTLFSVRPLTDFYFFIVRNINFLSMLNGIVTALRR